MRAGTLGNIVRVAVAILVCSLVALLVWLDLGSVGFRSWLRPEPILSAAALVLGFILLSWQLNRQHVNALEANRREAQDKLRLDIFNTIAARIEATNAPLTYVGSLPTGFVGELVIRERTGAPSRHGFDDFQRASKQASDSVIALMAILELYEIVMPEFVVFRKRLAEVLQRVSVASGDFLQLAGGYLGPLAGAPPPEHTKELSRLASATQAASIAVSGVVWDLRVEAQNHLLGGLFPGRRVPPRTPGDPSVQVTSIESARGGARV